MKGRIHMYRMIIAAIILAALIAPTTQAQTYTISSPRLVLHTQDHLVQIKWYQSTPKLVTVMKLTQSHHYNVYCRNVDWGAYLRYGYGFKYCFDIFHQWIPSGYITVTDKKYQRGDVYYIIEYMYTSHNAPYGPFKP